MKCIYKGYLFIDILVKKVLVTRNGLKVIILSKGEYLSMRKETSSEED